MRDVEAGLESPRLVTIPAAWEDRGADALAALAPGDGPVSIASASAVWLGLIAERARAADAAPGLMGALHGLLAGRRAAPTAPLWRGEPTPPGFVLNVAAFHVSGAGFDLPAFADAVRHVAVACALWAPQAAAELGLSGLDDLLAALGLPYASQAARDTASALAALLRGLAVAAREPGQLDMLATGADWPAPPAVTPIPGLAQAAAAARASARVTPGSPPCTGTFPPSETDALLGIETAGVAPAWGPVAAGRLTRATLDRLAAGNLSPEAALAASLSGDDPLPIAPEAAYAAMHAAVAPYLHAMPALPDRLPAPPPRPAPRPRARRLPPHAAGVAQKVTVGGHRVFLRTGEFDDGSIGEVTIALPKEGATTRALIECLAQAVSIGLQHGVRLDPYVDAFAATRFGPAGVVEGDPAVAQASSVLDYVFRALAANYLGRRLPEPVPELEAEDVPLLPLQLPPRVRRRALRIVG